MMMMMMMMIINLEEKGKLTTEMHMAPRSGSRYQGNGIQLERLSQDRQAESYCRPVPQDGDEAFD